MLAKLYYLICDGCGNPSSQGEDSGREARVRAQRAGWRRVPGEQHRGHVAGRDLCPKCRVDRHDRAAGGDPR